MTKEEIMRNTIEAMLNRKSNPVIEVRIQLDDLVRMYHVFKGIPLLIDQIKKIDDPFFSDDLFVPILDSLKESAIKYSNIIYPYIKEEVDLSDKLMKDILEEVDKQVEEDSSVDN